MLPVVLVVVLAVFEAIATVVVQIELVAAAREGVRVAATVPDPAEAVAAVRAALAEPLDRRVRVDVVRPAAVGHPARVTVRFERPLSTPLLEGITIPLGATAVMRVEP